MDNEGTDERGRLLTSTQVAAIWNARAAEMGYPDTHYSRFSVRERVLHGSLVPVQPGVALYWERDARAIKLYPQKSTRKDRDA